MHVMSTLFITQLQCALKKFVAFNAQGIHEDQVKVLQ